MIWQLGIFPLDVDEVRVAIQAFRAPVVNERARSVGEGSDCARSIYMLAGQRYPMLVVVLPMQIRVSGNDSVGSRPVQLDDHTPALVLKPMNCAVGHGQNLQVDPALPKVSGRLARSTNACTAV